MAGAERDLDGLPKDVRTPEGDNEGTPDQPLSPATDGGDGLQKPPAIDTNKL
jgi:hypothetical protein